MDNLEAIALCQLNESVLSLSEYIHSLDPSLDKTETLVLTNSAINAFIRLIKENQEIEVNLKESIVAIKNLRHST